MNQRRAFCLAVCLCIGSHTQVAAQLIVFDQADQAAYADGWQAGDNGGFGLGGWQDLFSAGGFFLGSATGNGGANPQTIDTSGTSWGLGSGGFLQRNITAPVGVGATLSIAFDAAAPVSSLSAAARVAVQSDADQAIVYAGFDPGQYSIGTTSPSGRFLTGIPVNGDGVLLKFTILQASVGPTAGSIRVSLTPIGGSEVTTDRPFFGSQLTVLQFSGPTGSDPNFYFNQISAVVPEPNQISMVAAAGLLIVALVRHCRGLRS